MADDLDNIEIDFVESWQDVAERRGVFPKQGAIATFLFKVMPVDGQTHPKELERLTRILSDDFSLDEEQAAQLVKHARSCGNSSSALEEMAQVLKAQAETHELLTLISHMWEMVFADGRLHETEILFVERVASLLDIDPNQVAEAMNH